MSNGKSTGTTPRDREGRRLWIQTEAGEFLPVRSQEDIAKRGRGPGLPDWWVVDKDPDWLPSGGTQGPARTLLAAGKGRGAADDADADEDTGGGAGGTKIGAGNKPQPYGWHGWYGPTGGGGVRGKDSKRPEGSGAGPGKTSKRPATGIWKNDERGKPDPKPEDVTPRTRETVKRLAEEVPGVERFTVNSGLREGDAGPHGEGRAVDIHQVNEVRLAEVAGKTGANAEQARQNIEKIENWARDNPDVQAFFSPFGGFVRDPVSGEIVREATRKEIEKHTGHIHITVRK